MVLKRKFNPWVKKTEKGVAKLAKEPYMINALSEMRKKGIIVDWTKPEEQVKETLTNGLKAIGENKYVADQAAKSLYLKVAPILSGKKSSLIIPNPMPKKNYEREGYKTDRLGRRFESDDFRKFVRRTADQMMPEFNRIVISPNAQEKTYVDAVKLSHTFWKLADKMPGADAEKLAVNLAREFKARRRMK